MIVGFNPPFPLPELWGRGEIAEALGVTVKAVDAWRQRPDFPEPAYRFAHGPVWLADEVREWRRRVMAERLKRKGAA